jgi:hypothetical protein
MYNNHDIHRLNQDKVAEYFKTLALEELIAKLPRSRQLGFMIEYAYHRRSKQMPLITKELERRGYTVRGNKLRDHRKQYSA